MSSIVQLQEALTTITNAKSLILQLAEPLKQYFQLKDIVAQIENSLELLDLEQDWDGEGAMPVNSSMLIEAIKWLTIYSLQVLEKNGKILEAPYVGAERDGDVYIHFDNFNTVFLITFRSDVIKEQNKAFFYGEVKGTGSFPFQSYCDLDKVNEPVVAWLSHYLSF